MFKQSYIINSCLYLWQSSLTARLLTVFGSYMSKNWQSCFIYHTVSRDMVVGSCTYRLFDCMVGNLERLMTRVALTVRKYYFKDDCGIIVRPVFWYFTIGSCIVTAILVSFIDSKLALKIVAVVLTMVVVFILPEAGLYLVALSLPFLSFSLLALLGVLTAIAYLTKVVVNGSANICRSSLLIPVLVFFAIMLYGTVTSVLPKSSAYEFAIPAVSMLYLFLMVNLIDNKKKLNILLTCLALAAAAVAAYAIYDYYYGVTFIDMQKGWVDPELNPDITNRASAVFENPNLLAQYFVLVIPVLASFTVVVKRVGYKFLLASIAILAGTALVLTYSRGGLYGFLFAMAVLAVIRGRKFFPLFLLAAIIGIFFLPHTVIERLATADNLNDSSVVYRFDIWKSTLLMIKDYWLTGVGVGTQAFMRVYYVYMMNSAIMPHAHNLYLQLLSEIGVFGLAFFMLLMYKIFQTVFRISSSDSSYLKWLNAGFAGAMAGFLLQSMFDYGLWYYKLGVLFWILIAVYIVLEKLYVEEKGAAFNGRRL